MRAAAGSGYETEQAEKARLAEYERELIEKARLAKLGREQAEQAPVSEPEKEGDVEQLVSADDFDINWE